MLPQGLGGPVRVDWEEQHSLATVLGRDIRVVNAGIGHHESQTMLNDQQTRAMANYPLRFGQHHLDKARVLIDLGGERYRALRRLYGCDIDKTSLGLRDDLLRNDQYIAYFRGNPIVPQCGDGNRTEIVARLDQLDTGQWGESDFPTQHPSVQRNKGSTCSA